MPEIYICFVPATVFAATFPSVGGLLGIIGFGASRPTRSACPFAEAEVTVLDQMPTYEVWQSDGRVSYRCEDGVLTARDDAFLFGVIEANESAGANFAALTYDSLSADFQPP